MDYSLIIPHRDSAMLLRVLLESVDRNLDVQIIVIDDNSTDLEFEAVERLQKEYAFELYKNEGTTAGGARNTGMRYAKGKWLMFADADDYFTCDMYQLLESHSKSDADIVFFNVGSRKRESGEIANRDRHIKHLFRQWEKQNDESVFRCKYIAPWGKICKRSFIEKNAIQFEECIGGNDMLFSVRTGVEAGKIEIDTHELYICTASASGITASIGIEFHEAKLQATLRTNDYLREHGCWKHQVSVLYFIAKAHRYGIRYMLHVLNECLKHRSNLIIGMDRILSYKKVLEYRQDPASFR